MRKIIEYRTMGHFEAINPFDQEINRLIGKGWQPLGAAFINGKNWYQTMVKYEEISDGNTETNC